MVKFLNRKEVNMPVHVAFEQIDSKNVYYIVRVASYVSRGSEKNNCIMSKREVMATCKVGGVYVSVFSNDRIRGQFLA